ncbi:peptidoglycan synthetase FtsI [Nocardioides scoriae]|uniref:Peptidoglycan synthetase FtsI n=1 Tax=Nocardioides scoriae TaxID=642780 RepID=A0A1H1L907_9ACTN|nr:penicillin-binding protein 2 [Nocardioides scoriae]SDR70379.1 peptidoglycan synthetase FtsI [Nocardioides scoriae]
MSQPRRSLRGTSHVRLRIGLIAITMLLSLFGARLFQIQGIDARSYTSRAEAAGAITIDLPAKRGRILDRDGQPLAESVAGLMLVADPATTRPHAEAIAKVMAERLDLDYFDLLTKLTKQGTNFVYLARRVPSTLATSVIEELRTRELPGVDTRSDPLRHYPDGDVAANLLGFINDAGEPGAGLELAFDRLLAGKDGKETYEVGGGNRIPLGENSTVEPVDGQDLRLTIDRDVQWFSQRVLCSAVQQVQAESGSAVVMDTRTGELIALADCPTFNPNRATESPEELLGSRAVSDVYEPGSVEKVLTFASLLDANKVTPSTRYTVPGELPVLDRVIGDWFDHGTLQLTSAGILAQSSNIGTTLAASQFSATQLHDYLTRFGLGERTDIGLPGESRGLLPGASDWSTLSRAQISFGQGLSVNAVQMAAAVNAVGNAGELVEPSLVEGEERTDDGLEVGTATATKRRAVSAKAAAEVSQMMELVTTPDVGTAPGAGIEGYRVAGKTGTAQQAGGDCSCYADGGVAVSFGGFAPADDARFTVYVVVNKPAAGGSGAGTAGPVFRKILSYVLQKYAVAPTGTAPSTLPTTWADDPSSVGQPSARMVRPGATSEADDTAADTGSGTGSDTGSGR